MRNFKKIINLAFLLFSILIYSQEKKVKVIKIDYTTKSFIKDNIIETIDVNEWVQFKVVNAPKNIKYEGNLTYTNKNLELRNTFGSYLTFSKENGYLKNDSIKSKKNEVKKNNDNDDKKNKEKIRSINDTIIQNVELKKYKDKNVDLNTMIVDLEIGNTENYLRNQKSKEAINAKLDIKWQKYLIEILKKNLMDRIKFKDSLIVLMANENKELVEKIEKNTDTIYFPATKIENYDFSVFSFNFKNKDIIDNLNIPITIKKGFKLDFSTGFIFNGLQNQNYKIINSETAGKVVIKEVENGLSFNTGIAILTHAYSRSAKDTNFGLTTGLSFNLNNQNLNYVLGASLLLGKDQRFIISSGATTGRVKELVKYREVDKDIASADLALTADVPTTEKLKASWFFSLTYNLGVGESSKTIKF